MPCCEHQLCKVDSVDADMSSNTPTIFVVNNLKKLDTYGSLKQPLGMVSGCGCCSLLLEAMSSDLRRVYPPHADCGFDRLARPNPGARRKRVTIISSDVIRQHWAWNKGRRARCKGSGDQRQQQY